MKKRQGKKFKIIILVLAVSSGVFFLEEKSLAAPSVSGISGTISNGSVVTITGNGFGTTGPNVVLFDDFELGTNGGNLSDQVRNAQIGTWRDVSGSISPYYPTYSNAQAHSGSLAVRQNWGSGSGTQEGARWIGATMGGTYNNIYFSFWTYLPVGQNVPGSCSGTGCGAGPNWKVWWLSTNDAFQNDYASEIITDPPRETTLCWVDGSANRSCYGYAPFSFTKGRWKRWEVHLVGSTTNGSGQLWFTDSGNTRTQWGSITGRTLDDGTTGWGYLHFPGYGRYDSNSNTYYDDIYVASGSGAQARVEIGNTSTYDTCTNLTIATVNSWSNTSVNATVRQGSFSSGSAYLYVIDSTGAVNASGYPITIGSGGGDTTPPTWPTGTTFSASTTSSSSITVSWSAAIDDTGVTSYELQRCTGLPASCPDASFSTVSPSATSPFTDSGLSANTDYSYRVRAKDAANNLSGWTNVVSAKTQSGTPAPTVSLSANPTSITFGQSSMLTWSSANATICTASGSWSGTKATSGTQSVSPTSTSTYTLTCTGTGGSANQSVMVTVGNGSFTFGETAILSVNDSGNSNTLVTQEAALSQPGTLQSLSLYVVTAAGNLRLGIYDATGSGGGPGNLLSQTSSVVPTTSWNTVPVSPTALSAGTYWLAFLSDSNSLVTMATTGSGSYRYYTHSFGSLSNTLSNPSGDGSGHYSLYATLTQPTTPPASCNTVTTTNFSQSAYNSYGAPFDAFQTSTNLLDAKCNSADTHTINLTTGITGDTTRIIYTKGYYYDPVTAGWTQYSGTCNGALNGEWCQGSVSATITNPNISTASASNPTYLVGMTCSVQNGSWRCGCRDTTCANFYWQVQGAGQ